MSLLRSLLRGALALALAPSVAQAAQIQPLKPCYVSVQPHLTEPIAVQGGGFTPNAAVEIRVDGTVVDTRVADAGGALGTTEVFAPFRKAGEGPFDVTVTEQGNPLSAITRSSRVTPLAVSLTPRRARPSSTITWRGRGFTAAGPVYAHYLYAGKHKRTARLGRPSGPCGTFRLRRAQFPFDPRTGVWTLRVDQDRAYRPLPSSNYVQLTIVVSRAT